MHIGTLTASLGVDTHGLNKAGVAMQRFQQKANISMAKVTKTLDKTGRNMYYFGTAAGRFLTLPLALAGVAAFKAAKDFESSMQKIVGLVGVAQTQVNEWSQELLKLGPEIGKSPKELAEALYFVTSSGFKGAEAMTILTESAKAAASGLGETKDVADLATSAMSAYKSSGLTASRVMDVLTAAVREGKGEAVDFAKQMGEVIPVASKMGVSFDQIAAAMSAVTLTGMNVSEAATGIKRILISLIKVTPQAEKTLNAMGTSGQEMRNIFRDQGMLSGLMKLNTLFNKFGEDMIGKVFPNVRALLPVLSLTGDRLQDNIKLFDAVNKSLGNSETAYKATSETIERKYNKALAAAQSSMITFGMALKGPITSFLEGFSNKIQSLTNWFSNLTKTQQEWVLKIGVTIAALSPLTIAVGLLMRSFAGLAMIIKVIIPFFVQLKLAMLTNPVLALGLALGTLTAYYLIPFIATTKQATTAQKEFNDELAKGNELAGVVDSLEKRMLSLKSMNAYQLQVTKERILNQLKLEQDYSIDLESELRKRLKNDEELKALQQKLRKTTRNELKAYILTEIQDRKEFLAKDVGLEYNANQNRLKLLQDYLKRVDTILSTMGNGGEGKKEIDYTTMFDSPKEALEWYQRELDKAKYFKFEMPEFEEIDYTSLFKIIGDSGEPLENLNNQLARIALHNSLVTDSFNASEMSMKTLDEQIQYTSQMYDQLFSMYPKGNALLDTYIEKLKELKIQQESVNRATEIGNTVAREFTQAMESNIESAQDLGNALRRAAISAIAAIVAEAIATNVAKAVSKSKTWWGAIIAGAAAGAATKALFESTIPKFAEGGKVPAGYPNDTYPALLTSGEIVTPPGKLENLQKQGGMKEGEVVLRIEGYDLVGILKKYSNKLNTV